MPPIKYHFMINGKGVKCQMQNLQIITVCLHDLLDVKIHRNLFVHVEKITFVTLYEFCL